ncbi:MAG: DUF2628 domain-containing protein [Sphingobacteriales bacterium]|nr:MAG: DUF2628 domain-containing protein [Sphingobacteriales bacterium]
MVTLTGLLRQIRIIPHYTNSSYYIEFQTHKIMQDNALVHESLFPDRLPQLFFQDDSGYYLERYQDYCDGKNRITLNVWAFLFGIFWFLYRKMYVEALLLFAFLLLEGFAEEYLWEQLFDSTPGTWVSRIVSGVVTCLLGNYLYFRKADRVIAHARTLNDADGEDYARSAGGTTWLALFILLAIAAIYIALGYNGYLD